MARIRIERLDHSEQALSADDAAQVMGAGYYWGGPSIALTPWGLYGGGGRVYTPYTPYVPYPAVYPGVPFYGGYPGFAPMLAPAYGFYGP